MFLLNSRRTRFTAAHLRGRSFSRSYGANLPSSLTSFHSSAFGYSPRLPVSVWGTVPFVLLRGFSWQRGIIVLAPKGTALRLTVKDSTDLPIESSFTRIDRYSHMAARLSFCVTPSSNEHWEVRNINRMSIGYAFRPHLRDRLTLSGLTFLRKP